MFSEIIAGLHARDERVQEHIYKLYWGHLMAVASRYFKDRTTIREVVNDSFMKGFKVMYEFKHEGEADEFEKSFKSWLSRITVRTALDKIRKSKSLVTYVEEHEETEALEISVEQRLNVQDILKLLHELPEIHRAVFNLYEIEGYSHDEIADLLGIQVSSSRTFLTRAKNRLRNLYNKRIAIGNERS